MSPVTKTKLRLVLHSVLQTQLSLYSLYLGETERLLRKGTLASLLEAAALALRSGRGLIGDGAGDLVREIWNSYPGAGLKNGETQQASSHGGDVDQGETGKGKSS